MVAKKIKINGMDIERYIGFVMFSDAFSDIIESDYPEMVDDIFQPGADMLASVSSFLKEKGIDPEIYIDERPAIELIKNVSKFWDGKMTVNQLAKFDPDAITTLSFQSLGSNVDLKDLPRVAQFLKQNDLKVPNYDDVKVSEVRPYVAAYKAVSRVV